MVKHNLVSLVKLSFFITDVAGFASFGSLCPLVSSKLFNFFVKSNYFFLLGSCYVTVNPMNMTTCWNSSANFSCAINETKQIFWLINGQDVLKYNLVSPYTFTNATSCLGAQSTLIVPGSYEFDGAYVTCYYIQPSTSLKLYSTPAFLRVQGSEQMCDHFSCYDGIVSLGPPLNLTATLIGNSLIQLSWIPSNGGWIGSFLDYTVLVKDGNGVVVHNETVRVSQLIINTSSDPCSQYYATVAPVCQGTVSVASIGGSQIPGGNVHVT